MSQSNLHNKKIYKIFHNQFQVSFNRSLVRVGSIAFAPGFGRVVIRNWKPSLPSSRWRSCCQLNRAPSVVSRYGLISITQSFSLGAPENDKFTITLIRVYRLVPNNTPALSWQDIVTCGRSLWKQLYNKTLVSLSVHLTKVISYRQQRDSCPQSL